MSKKSNAPAIKDAAKNGPGKLTLMKKYWQIYVLVIPAVIWYILFAYYPMAGLQLAFKTYLEDTLNRSVV